MSMAIIIIKGVNVILKKILSVLISFIMVCSLLEGCRVETVSNIEDKEDYIVYGVDKLKDNDIDILDRKDVKNALYDKLLSTNSRGEVVPALIGAYKVSDDGIEYNFSIREDAMWSDGTKMTSDDLISFFKNILSPDNNDKGVEGFFSIYGAKNYHEGKTSFSGVAISKVDEDSIKVRMNNKDDNFLNNIANCNYVMAYGNTSSDEIRSRYKEMKFSGPLIIHNIDDDGSVILSRNGYYYDNDDIKDNFKIKISEYNGVEEELAYMNMGKIDFFEGVPRSEASSLFSENRLQCIPTNKSILLTFNSEKEIPGLSEFRNAINKLIAAGFYNYDGVLDGTYICSDGNIIRKDNDIFDVFLDYEDYEKRLEKINEYNISIAKSLYKSIDIKGTTVITLGTSNEYEDIAEHIKDIIEKNTNIDVDICIDNNKSDKYDMYLECEDFSDDNVKKTYVDMFNDDKQCIPVLFANKVICRSDRVKYIDIDNKGILRLDGIKCRM